MNNSTLNHSSLVFFNFAQYLPFLRDRDIRVEFGRLREAFSSQTSGESSLFCNLLLGSNSPKNLFALKKWLETHEGFQRISCPSVEDFLMFLAGKISTHQVLSLSGESAKEVTIIDDFSSYKLSEVEKILRFIKVELDRKTLKGCTLVTTTFESKHSINYLKDLYMLENVLVLEGDEIFNGDLL